MSPLDPLAPDQRAVVALVLQQGRSYDDIAALLGIPVGAVRARAHAGLAALAPENGLPLEITGPLADYLLAQQSDADAGATRGLLAESAVARAWATGVADRLADVAPAPLPAIPSGPVEAAAPAPPAAAPDTAAPAPDSAPPAPDSAPPAPDSVAPAPDTVAPAPDTVAPAPDTVAPVPDTAPPAPDTAAPAASADAAPPATPVPEPGAPAPRPRPVREAAAPAESGPPASSKLGGILLIVGVVAVVGVVLFLVLRGGDDPSGETPASASATPTPSATAQPQVTDQIPLRPPNGGKANATMTVYLQGEQLMFALQGEQLPPTNETSSYAVWLTGPGDKARLLGYVPVGQDGALGISGPQDKDLEAFPQWYATYEKVVLSRESTEDVKRPSNVVLSGKLPAGR